MAYKQIPNLVPAIGLDGSEQLEIVQGTTSKRATVTEIANFATAGITGVESISFGTLGFGPAAPATGDVVVTGVLNITAGGTGAGGKTEGFDNLSPATARGDLITRNTADNIRLPIGAANTVLTSNGNDPVWLPPATSGTVTSVAMSGGTTGLTFTGGPITSSGTFTAGGTLAIANGGTGATAKLGAFDNLSPVTTRGDLIVRNASNNVRLPLGANNFVLTSNGTDVVWAAPATSGTVTSVAMSGGTTGLTFTGGPITSSGTFTAGGTLAIANGGTGQTTALGAFNALSPLTTRGDVLTRDATNNTRLPLGAANTVLTSNGTDIIWATPPGTGTVTSVAMSGGTTGLTFTGGPITTSGTFTAGGTLAVANGGTGVTSLAGLSTAMGLGTMSTQNANAVAITGGTATLTGGSLNGSFGGATVFANSTGIVFSAGTATTLGNYILCQPTDYGVGKPRLAITKTAVATTWNIQLFDTVNSAGTINFQSATGLTWNDVQLVTTSGTQTLSNKTLTTPTINGGAMSGTFSGNHNYSGVVIFTGNLNATTAGNMVQFRPTDMGTDKPYMYVGKNTTTADRFDIGLTDSSDNTGTINFDCGTSLTWNNVQLVDLSRTQTLTNKTLTSPIIATPTFTGAQTFNTATINFNGAGNCAFEIGRVDGSASTPFIDFHSGATAANYDSRIIASGGTGADGGGDLNIIATNLTHNSVPIITTTGSQTLSNKTLTTPTINGAAMSGTWSGAATRTGLDTISLSNSTTATEYLQFRPTDFAVGKPYLTIQKGGTATAWNISLWDGAVNTGIINISASDVRANNIPVVTDSGTQTLTNKTLTTPTINGATLSGTFAGPATFSGAVSFTSTASLGVATATAPPAADNSTRVPTTAWVLNEMAAGFVTLAGAQTLTGLKTVSLGTSVTQQAYATWSPTDFALGKPQLTVRKETTADKWNLMLWDGTNSNGNINLVASTLTWNDVPLVGTTTSQTLTNKTLTNPTINAAALSGTITGAPTFSGNLTLSGTNTVSGVTTFSTAPVIRGASLVIGPTTAANSGLELGQQVGGSTTTTFIDFHSGTTPVDFDSRISATGGTGVDGGGSITITAAGGINWASNGVLVGTTATQTLTNKTLTSPTINGAAMSGTITGTPTFSGAVVFSGSPSLTTPTLSSPAMTGTPTAPTATLGTNTTQVATTAFVLTNAISSSRLINTGKGLAGGGDLSADRTLKLDINSLDDATTPLTGATRVAIYNSASPGLSVKVPLSDLLTGYVPTTRLVSGGNGLENSGSGPALSSDVTIHLRTPGTLNSTTTNDPNGAHTHSINHNEVVKAGSSNMVADDLGSYFLARQNGGGAAKTWGDTISGSNLSSASAAAGGGAATPSGSWRCMGRITGDTSTNNNTNITLWLRIS